MKRAVCLVSGGLDSAVTAALAKSQDYEVYALTFDYGQRHKKEIEAAKKVAGKYAAEHRTVKLDLSFARDSALTSSVEVPKGKSLDEIKGGGIPVTYVPARNTIMLSIALAYAESVCAESIFIGANCVDYSGYPDCRPEYFWAFQELADLATKTTVEGGKIVVRTPLIKFSKKHIVEEGVRLGVDFKDTWSCYEGGEKACGVCDSCALRLQGFREAGVEDPLEYERI